MIELKLFSIFFLSGIVFACIWGMLNFIKIIFKHNKIANQIIEIIYAVMFSVSLFSLLVNFNYGQFRLYLIIAVCFGFLLERKTLGKLFARIHKWLYNKIVSLINKIKLTKFGKRVFK